MIFRTVNAEIEKTQYKIAIKNIDLAGGHWGSEKEIISAFDEVENYTYEPDKFNKNIVLFALKLKEYNIRVRDIVFYRIKEENKLILLATTDVRRINKYDIFSREMSIAFKKDNKFVFSIIELLEEEAKELKEKEQSIPANWVKDEYLTDRYKKLSGYLNNT